MTEFDKADTNGDGVIQPDEWEKLRLEERRLEINDRDLKRDAEQLKVALHSERTARAKDVSGTYSYCQPYYL